MEETLETQNSQEQLTPLEVVEWLAVGDVLGFEESVMHVDKNRLSALGYLAKEGNSRAVAELESFTQKGWTYTAGVSAIILAEANNDSTWLDKALEIMDTVSSQGAYDGAKYRDAAFNSAMKLLDDIISASSVLGTSEKLRADAEGWHSTRAKEIVSERLNSGSVNETSTSLLLAPDLSPEMESEVSALLQSYSQNQDFDSLLTAISQLDNQNSRLVAYTHLAQTLKGPEQQVSE